MIKPVSLSSSYLFLLPFGISITQTKSSGEILVQGVIDLLAVKGDEAVIVDYKASMKNAEHVAETYRAQLILYKKAVERILKLIGSLCAIIVPI